MKKVLVLSSVLLMVFPTYSLASVIHFDEFGTSPVLNVNGMDVFGVAFGFTPGRVYPDDEAYYNGQIGTAGLAVLVSDPLLTGPSDGTLRLAFHDPTPLLQFDLILQTLDTIDTAYSVTLSSGEVLSGSTTPQPGGFYSEGTFRYSGAPITRADITFFQGPDSIGGNVSAFGLDNLTYEAPEPGTPLLLAGGLLAVGVLSRRRARG